MNRQQQRAAAKHRNGKPAKRNHHEINKESAWVRIQAKIFSNSIEPHTEYETLDMMNTVYPALLRLGKGLFDLKDFELLNLITAFGYELAGDIYRQGDAETKAAVMPGHEVLMSCADALLQIGERRNKTNKFGATGDEFQAIRQMVGFVEQLMNVSTRGLVLSALIRAEHNVATAVKTSVTATKGSH